MTTTYHPTRIAARTMAGALATTAAVSLLIGAAAAQGVEVGIDRELDATGVTHAAIVATHDFTPTVTALDAVITDHDDYVLDQRATWVPAPTTPYESMINEMAAAAEAEGR